MSRKKQYKTRLPTVLAAPAPPPVSPDLAPPSPPAPRAVPEAEQVPLPPAAAPAAPPETAPPAAPVDPPEAAPDAAPEAAPQPPVRRGRRTLATAAVWLVMLAGVTAVRRRRAVLTFAVLVVLLVGATIGGVLALRSGDTPEATDRPAPRSVGSITGTGPVPPGTSQVETTVRPDGTVVVRHRLRSREPLRSLSLALPPLEVAGTMLASDVRVVADGEPVAGPALVGPRGADFDLGSATDLRVTYRLSGVVLASGSAPGRALALTTSLSVSTDPAPDAEVRVVRAPGVLSLACAAPGDRPPVPCGTSQGVGEWRVDLAGARLEDRVVAQLTVPGLDGAT